MGSRIAHHIDFPDYTLEELMGIAKLMLAEQQYEFSEEAEAAFRDYLERRMKQPRFANGRSVRNAIERSRLRQAARIVAESKTVSKKDLLRIEAEDILKSRVFSDEEEAPPDVDGTDRDEADVGSAAGDSPEDGAGEDRADTGEGTGEDEE
jgi:hypothetical protein